MQNRERILDVEVDRLGFDGTIERLQAWTAEPQPSPKVFATVNQYSLWRATRETEFRKALESADLVVPDGFGAIWASRCLGGSLRERVAGPDVTQELLRRLNEGGGASCFFLGSTEDNLRRIERLLAERFPNLRLVGSYSPPFRDSPDAEEDAKALAAIDAVNPDLLFVGLGAPKQELWVERNRHGIRSRVVLSVGAAFDFLSGSTSRAPLWMQRRGLEWSYRLATDFPRMWKRYLVAGPAFAWALLRARVLGSPTG